MPDNYQPRLLSLEKIALSLSFCSGAAALIYETVWLRMLIRIFGITVYAVSFVTAFFILGLALGSALAGNFSLKKGRWLFIYGLIEIALAVSALLTTWLLVLIPHLAGGSLTGGALACAAALVIPTMLMGATLPLLLRGITDDGAKASFNLSLFYGVNTLGAMAGVFSSGFVALAVLGEKKSALLAAALNLTIGLIALQLSKKRPGKEGLPQGEAKLSREAGFVLALMAASGFCATGYQVLWTRMFTVITGTSVYAFAALLTVYLAGIGAGSCLAPALIRRSKNHLATFGLLELLLGAAAATGLEIYRLIGLAKADPVYLYSPIISWVDIASFFASLLAVVFPATFIMGLLFPLAGMLCSPTESTVGYVTGRLYLWNTGGCVAGALLTGFVFISLAGMKYSFVLMVLASAAIGVAAFAQAKQKSGIKIAAAGVLLVAMVFVNASLPDPYADIILNRCRAAYGEITVLFHTDTPAATVTGVEHGLSRNLLVNGIVVSGNGKAGKVMIQLPAAIHGTPKKILVICFGVGTTFETARRLAPEVHVAELLGPVIEHGSAFNTALAQDLHAPGVKIFINDGRNYLLSTREKYDIIIVDASPPIFSAGTVNLYSREFLELAQAHLNPGGIYTLWIPLPCHEGDVWQIVKNFTAVFPHQAVWAHPKVTGGFIAMGSDSAFEWPAGLLENRFLKQRGDPQLVKIDETNFRAGLAGVDSAMAAALRDYPGVTDDMPRTEFPFIRFWRNEPLEFSIDFISAKLRPEKTR